MKKNVLFNYSKIQQVKFFLLIFFVGISLKAQTNPFDGYKVSINRSNVPIRLILYDIQQQTGGVFTYSNDQFNEAENASINVINASLDKALSLLFNNTEFTWRVNGKNIIIEKNRSQTSLFKQIKDSSIIVIGIVVNEDGDPIPGATILAKNGKQGTQTNDRGEFVFKNFPARSTMIITSIGYMPEEFFPDKKEGQISIVLKQNINKLDEAVVAAYNITSQRKSVGGGISTISSSTIEKKPITNSLLALQGEVPGVNITQSTGMANSGVTVQIRGQNSILSGNSPLYVIDGVPYSAGLLPSLNGSILGSSGTALNLAGSGFTQGNPLSFIDPASIESISVLKDADATSIYGSRAASGAILITTKKGKSGVTKVNVNMQNGWGKISRRVHVLNAKQYLTLRHEAKAYSNDPILETDYDLNGTWDTTKNTDWQKELIGGTARYADAKVSASGGNNTTQFFIGVGYHRETPVFAKAPGSINRMNQKGSVNFNINNVSNNQKFRVSLSGNYMVDNNDLPIADFTNTALSLAPVAPSLLNNDGSLNWAPDSNGSSSWFNPLAYGLAKSIIKTNNLVSNMQLSYELSPSWRIKTSLGYTSMQVNELRTSPSTIQPPEARNNALRSTRFSGGNINSWIVEPQITYNKISKIGQLELLIGSSLQYSSSYQQSLRGLGYTSDLLLEDPKAAPTLRYGGTVSTVYKYNAAFGMLNYNWKERYYINLSARRDGSSRFGESNLFHNFGSIAGAWILTNEPVFQKQYSALSFAKLRVSYGTTGNDQIGDYQFLNLYNQFNTDVAYQGTVGLLPSALPNPRLQWELTRKLQLGFDLGFIHDKILVNFNYYRNRSSNQLLTYKLPTLTGFDGIVSNFPATVQNKGVELTINTNNLNRKSFTWSTSFNLSIPRNKLVSFPDFNNSPYVNDYIIGKTLNLVKVYTYAGIDNSTNLFTFKDSHGNNTSNPDYLLDRTTVLDLNPKYYGGFQNSFNYKGIQLDILFQFTKQIGRNYNVGYQPGTLLNQPVSVLEKGMHQQYASTYSGDLSTAYDAIGNSNFVYGDASYIRLKTLSLSYSFPENWLKSCHIQQFRVYSHAQNLLTFTKYRGLDPENPISYYYAAALPVLRMITVGIQATL